MYNNWFTIFQTRKEYQPDNYIRRDEAAKLFVKFAQNIDKTTYKYTAEECNFTDLNNAHQDLKDIILESCRLGIFQWSAWKFMPTNSITNEQAVTVLVRILVWKQSEIWTSYRSENYYKKANELQLLSNVSMNSRELFSTRGNIGILLATNSMIEPEIEQKDFTIPACNKFIELMRCVAEKTGWDEESYNAVHEAINAWKTLPEDQLIDTCNMAIEAAEPNKSEYITLGCDRK